MFLLLLLLLKNTLPGASQLRLGQGRAYVMHPFNQSNALIASSSTTDQGSKRMYKAPTKTNHPH